MAIGWEIIDNFEGDVATKNDNRIKEFVSFSSSRVLTLLMDMVIKGVMVNIMGIHHYIALATSMVAVTISNYFLSKFLVFKKK